MSHWYDDDQAPYSMIGVHTTLPGRCRNVAKRPIGFVWPKQEKRKAPTARAKPRIKLKAGA